MSDQIPAQQLNAVGARDDDSSGTRRADANIEFGHFYAHPPGSRRLKRQLRESERTAREAMSLLHMLQALGLECSTSLLVDNYNWTHPLTLDDVQAITADWPLVPDYVVWESEVSTLAPSLIRQLDSRFVTTDGRSRFLVVQGHDIEMENFEPQQPGPIDTLLSGFSASPPEVRRRDSDFYYRMEVALEYHGGRAERIFGCPLITACWHLARLGYAGLPTPRYQQLRVEAPSFVAAQVYSVLPTRYLLVEAEVRAIFAIGHEALRTAGNQTRYLFV
jgi:hypothetical protein